MRCSGAGLASSPHIIPPAKSDSMAAMMEVLKRKRMEHTTQQGALSRVFIGHVDVWTPPARSWSGLRVQDSPQQAPKLRRLHTAPADIRVHTVHDHQIPLRNDVDVVATRTLGGKTAVLHRPP